MKKNITRSQKPGSVHEIHRLLCWLFIYFSSIGETQVSYSVFCSLCNAEFFFTDSPTVTNKKRSRGSVPWVTGSNYVTSFYIWEVNIWITRLQSNLPGMCTSLTGQCSVLPDDAALDGFCWCSCVCQICQKYLRWKSKIQMNWNGSQTLMIGQNICTVWSQRAWAESSSVCRSHYSLVQWVA